MLKHKKSTLLMALLFVPFLFMLSSGNASALSDTLTLGDDYIDVPSERYSNDAGTATLDPDTYTLTLNNYDDGEISYCDNKDLTVILKGNNIITASDSFYGFGIGCTDPANVTFTGDGSLTIAGDPIFGFYVYGDTTVNSGNITVEAKLAGIVSQHALIVNGGNLDITGGEDNAGVAIINIPYIETPGDGILITGNMQVSPANASLQTFPFPWLSGQTYNAVTFGQPDANIEALDPFEGTATTVNIASHVIISEIPTELPPENPNTFDHITSYITLGCISLISLIAGVAFTHKHRV